MFTVEAGGDAAELFSKMWRCGMVVGDSPDQTFQLENLGRLAAFFQKLMIISFRKI